jgi:hypothetical protein
LAAQFGLRPSWAERAVGLRPFTPQEAPGFLPPPRQHRRALGRLTSSLAGPRPMLLLSFSGAGNAG